MSMKNEYRMVLDAVLRLPWGEGLSARAYIDDDGLCCSIGAVAFGPVPRAAREFDHFDLHDRVSFSKRIFEIVDINDAVTDESPLARKHRMIAWLRERADATDRSSR